MAHHRKFERFMLLSHCRAFAAARDVAAIAPAGRSPPATLAP